MTVDGTPVDPTEDQSLLTLPLPADHDAVVTVELTFGYTLEAIAPADPLGGLLGGDNLAPASIGLLARHDNGLSLGHWFPLWMPDADGADAVPDGFGDIGNFPAAQMSAELTVPEGATVVTGASGSTRRASTASSSYEKRAWACAISARSCCSTPRRSPSRWAASPSPW